MESFNEFVFDCEDPDYGLTDSELFSEVPPLRLPARLDHSNSQAELLQQSEPLAELEQRKKEIQRELQQLESPIKLQQPKSAEGTKLLQQSAKQYNVDSRAFKAPRHEERSGQHCDRYSDKAAGSVSFGEAQRHEKRHKYSYAENVKSSASLREERQQSSAGHHNNSHREMTAGSGSDRVDRQQLNSGHRRHRSQLDASARQCGSTYRNNATENGAFIGTAHNSPARHRNGRHRKRATSPVSFGEAECIARAERNGYHKMENSQNTTRFGFFGESELRFARVAHHSNRRLENFTTSDSGSSSSFRSTSRYQAPAERQHSRHAGGRVEVEETRRERNGTDWRNAVHDQRAQDREYDRRRRGDRRS